MPGAIFGEGRKNTENSGQAVERQATIRNRRGLHARAAAKFVKLAGLFEADLRVAHRGQEVSGRSIMGLMMLAAGIGCTIELKAEGADAENAVKAIIALIDAKFDEE